MQARHLRGHVRSSDRLTMKQAGIYSIRCTVTGRVYIGSSVCIHKRWNEHHAKLRRGVHRNHLLQEAWWTHGEAAFAFTVVEIVSDRERMLERELFHIVQEGANAYNLASHVGVGPKPGRVMPADQRARVSSATKGKPKSAEHRAKISALKRGVPNPKHGDAIRGRKASDETKARMRAAHLGKRHTPEVIEKYAAKLRGRVFYDESRAKMSAAKRGRRWTTEHREKIGAGVRAANQRKTDAFAASQSAPSSNSSMAEGVTQPLPLPESQIH